MMASSEDSTSVAITARRARESANLGGAAFHRENDHWACQLLFPGEDVSSHEMIRAIVATGAQNDVGSMVLGCLSENFIQQKAHDSHRRNGHPDGSQGNNERIKARLQNGAAFIGLQRPSGGDNDRAFSVSHRRRDDSRLDNVQ